MNNRDLIEEKLYREQIVLAPILRRFFAINIDLLLVSFIFQMFFWNDLKSISGDTQAVVQFVSGYSLHLLLFMFVYEWLMTYAYGATLGKIVCKIRVVSIALLDHPAIVAAFLRALLKMLQFFIIPPLFCLVFFTFLRQGLHDWLAKSIVIKNA
ncbi:hypothetical protein BBW65_00485 [Helicobacter enhydrae]|uniref:RDD domain-containing protein n=1 Tax=Helicobacter enhydrae TaxID=222136 RepID=A0A1B1U3P1_9HELI|nr:RDD family protein [Helicobacter enhydrae]ANV97387.1 hypothetical protein BBW65_00485 [Helicobacter enhydrae]